MTLVTASAPQQQEKEEEEEEYTIVDSVIAYKVDSDSENLTFSSRLLPYMKQADVLIDKLSHLPISYFFAAGATVAAAVGSSSALVVPMLSLLISKPPTLIIHNHFSYQIIK